MIKKGLLSDRKYTIMPLTALKLFDAYVKPILLYNSALWAQAGVRNKNGSNPHTVNLVNLDSTEKTHYILGLSSRTSNIASCIELRRYPMEIEVKMSLIKYWKHIKSFPYTHILKQRYLENLNLTTICPNKNLWSSCIKATLESNGYGNVWHKNHEINLENIHKCLLDQYRQRAHSKIFNDNIKSGTANKLRTYRMYKSELEIENYIKTTTNYIHRKAMRKLRLSDADRSWQTL